LRHIVLRGPPKLPLGSGLLQGLSFGLKSNGVVMGRAGGLVLSTNIFILLKKPEGSGEPGLSALKLADSLKKER